MLRTILVAWLVLSLLGVGTKVSSSGLQTISVAFLDFGGQYVTLKINGEIVFEGTVTVPEENADIGLALAKEFPVLSTNQLVMCLYDVCFEYQLDMTPNTKVLVLTPNPPNFDTTNVLLLD